MKKHYCIILLIALISVCALTFTACSQNTIANVSDTVYGVNQISSKNLGEVPRTLPEITDGGLARYPQYNKLLSNATIEEKESILAENKELFNYDKIDKDGNLYKNGEILNRKLAKHIASIGVYGSEIPDSAKAYAKRIRITPHNIGNNMTGLYAAPGEIVTVILNQNDAKRNMFVDIGQCNARQGGNNIPVNKDFTRMPMLKTALKLTETVNYIGSPLGGPIYIRNEGGSLEPYEITVIGAIEMPHYFHAYTTDSEWENLKNAPAPLFDMEVYPGIRLSMPSTVIRSKTAQQMRDISEFWYKAMCLSNKVSNGAWFKDHPVTMLFDTYIPAGAAVAFVGADCCMLPIDWAKSAMNYDSIFKSGAWGTLHEFNHHHQGWGADKGGEVTNNVSNALTYMLYTDIAASRTEDGGLTGWNWVSDSYNTLKRFFKSVESGKVNTDLEMYVTLAHAFGSDAIIDMANNSTAKTHTAWYNAAVNATGYDMTYYLRDLCNLTIDDSAIAAVKAQNLPVFVPVASLYQSGIFNAVSNESINMGRAFTIPFGKDKELDFAKNIICPNDYNYEIISIDSPRYGKLSKINDLSYIYSPDKNELEVDSFNLYLKLTEKQTGNEVLTTLILSFKQNADGSHAEIWENPGYTDLNSAIVDNYEKKLKTIGEIDSDIAGITNNTKNSIIKVVGQVLPPADGDYEIFIKGSGAMLLYAGMDKKDLKLVASIDSALNAYSRDISSSHFTVKLIANKPFYYRLYLLNGTSKASCNMGWLDTSQIEGAPPVTEGGEVSGDAAAKAPIVDIPKTYIKKFDAKIKTVKQEGLPNKYAPNFTVNAAVFHDKTNVKVTAPPQYKGSSPENMLDNNPSTIMHTKVGIEFPITVSFDMGTAQNLNLFQFSSRDNSARGRIKNYVLYGGNSPIDMKVLSAGTAQNTYTNNIYFDAITLRYIKIEISDYYGNEKYIALSEVNFGTGLNNAAVVANTDSALTYSGDWNENRYGTYMNGALKESKKGEVVYSFKGTGAAIFAVLGRKYGIAEIKIDDGEWREINLYADTDKFGQCVFTTGNLQDAEHKLIMRAKEGAINVDYFAVNETMPIVNNGLGLWWVAIAIAIFAVILAVIAAIIITRKKFFNIDNTNSINTEHDNKEANSNADGKLTKTKIKFSFRSEEDSSANKSDMTPAASAVNTKNKAQSDISIINDTSKNNIEAKRGNSKIKLTFRNEINETSKIDTQTIDKSKIENVDNTRKSDKQINFDAAADTDKNNILTDKAVKISKIDKNSTNKRNTTLDNDAPNSKNSPVFATINNIQKNKKDEQIKKTVSRNSIGNTEIKNLNLSDNKKSASSKTSKSKENFPTNTKNSSDKILSEQNNKKNVKVINQTDNTTKTANKTNAVTPKIKVNNTKTETDIARISNTTNGKVDNKQNILNKSAKISNSQNIKDDGVKDKTKTKIDNASKSNSITLDKVKKSSKIEIDRTLTNGSTEAKTKSAAKKSNSSSGIVKKETK